MNRHLSNWSKMGNLTDIETYNKSVKDRDRNSMKIKKKITSIILKCPKDIMSRRKLFKELKEKYPDYLFHITFICSVFWK